MLTVLLIQANFALLRNAHSHNDYAQARPLQEALDNGFLSIEADIFLVDGELPVGHDRTQLKPGKTIESMYLDPLAARVKEKGGTVYGQPGTLILLVDIKEDGAQVQAELSRRLPKYKDMLSERMGSTVTARAVQIILSGARTADCAMGDGFLFKDGRPGDLKDDVIRTPMISEDYSAMIGSYALPMPAEGKSRFEALIMAASAKGMKVRLWGAPDTPAMWSALYDMGPVMINTDHLSRLREFLVSKRTG